MRKLIQSIYQPEGKSYLEITFRGVPVPMRVDCSDTYLIYQDCILESKGDSRYFQFTHFKHTLFAKKHRNGGYYIIKGRSGPLLGKVIMNAKEDEQVIYKNGDLMDNRKENLEIVKGRVKIKKWLRNF